MERVYRALAAILVASLGGVLLAAPAEARYDNPEAPDAGDEVRRDPGRIGRATKWRPRRMLVLQTSYGRLGVWLPYEPGISQRGTAALRVLINGYSMSAGEGNSRMLRVQFRQDCQTATGAAYTTSEWVGRFSRPIQLDSSRDEFMTGVSSIDGPTFGCGADQMVGVQVRLVLENQWADPVTVEAVSEVVRWHVDNENRGPEPPDDENWDASFCEATFGPPPWSPGDTGVLWGEVIKIEDTPCLDIQDDWATDFDKVCRNAPAFEFYTVLGLSVFPTMESLGAWVGHYARCLFNPQRGFDTSGIGDAADGGWMGASRSILSNVMGAFGNSGGSGTSAVTLQGPGDPFVTPPLSLGVSWEDDEHARSVLGDQLMDSLDETTANGSGSAGMTFGAASAGCGDFVETLPIIGQGVSSCDLGQAWPSSWRTAAGTVVMIIASFATLFGILRFMGVRYGWETG